MLTSSFLLIKCQKNIFTYCHLRDLLGDWSSLSNFLIFVTSLEHVDLITSKHQTHKQYKIQTLYKTAITCMDIIQLDLDLILKKKNNVTNLHANGLHIWREL